MTDSTAMTTASDPIAALDLGFRAAIRAVLGDEFADTDPVIRPSQNPKFGDFQANCAMALAKKVGGNPRDLAGRILEALDLGDLADDTSIAGPGFINVTLAPTALGRLLDAMSDDHLGVATDTQEGTVVVDLCGVNVAKQPHVGHLRATIIGDSLARVFERIGRTVHRENHLGDWGLPIAMVLDYLRKQGADLDALDLPTLDAAYRDAQLTCKADMRGLGQALDLNAGPHRIIELEEQNAGAHAAMESAKQTLIRLQQGDAEIVADWKKLIACTLRGLYRSLDLLNVHITEDHNRGESFYRDRLAGVIEAFTEANAAEEDDGALVVRFEDRERPMLIRKSDGGYLYATTDLAAVRYRVNELGADRAIYVVDARQRDHFRDLFDAARIIGWDINPHGRHADLVHIPFGSVLGADKKPLKTRSGRNVTLHSLLTEAIERGTAEVLKRAADPAAPTHGLSEEELGAIGKAVGIAAVKYADLSNDLVRDYVFDFDRMIQFEGNTGPYLQYAHARVCSIFSRAGIDPADVADAEYLIREPAEKSLALVLLRYGGTVADVASTLEPHRLCTYLYDLAGAYSAFYQNCPVLKAETDAVRRSRLRLCNLVHRVMADGLGLLGIEAPRRM